MCSSGSRCMMKTFQDFWWVFEVEEVLMRWKKVKCSCEVIQRSSKNVQSSVPKSCCVRLGNLLNPFLFRVSLLGFVFWLWFFLVWFWSGFDSSFCATRSFFCVRIVPRSQFGVIRLLSFYGLFWIFPSQWCALWKLYLILYDLSSAYCDMDIIP